MTNIDKAKRNIKEHLYYLQFRTSMVLINDNTFDLERFMIALASYLDGISAFCNVRLECEISKWYQATVEIKAPNLMWFSHFQLVNKNKNEKETIELLFTTLNNFFDERLDELLDRMEENSD